MKFQIRTGTLLLGMVPLAIVLGVATYVLKTYQSVFGPQVSQLVVGERVVFCDNAGRPIRVANAENVQVNLAAGTEAVVAHEPAWDQDSCYPMREIEVVLDDGPYRGRRVTVTREHLLPKR